MIYVVIAYYFEGNLYCRTREYKYGESIDIEEYEGIWGVFPDKKSADEYVAGLRDDKGERLIILE